MPGQINDLRARPYSPRGQSASQPLVWRFWPLAALLALAGTEPAAHSRLANDPPRHAGARRPALRLRSTAESRLNLQFERHGRWPPSAKACVSRASSRWPTTELAHGDCGCACLRLHPPDLGISPMGCPTPEVQNAHGHARPTEALKRPRNIWAANRNLPPRADSHA